MKYMIFNKVTLVNLKGAASKLIPPGEKASMKPKSI